MSTMQKAHKGDPVLDRTFSLTDFSGMIKEQTILLVFAIEDEKRYSAGGVFLDIYGQANSPVLRISRGMARTDAIGEWIQDIPLAELRQMYQLSPREIAWFLNQFFEQQISTYGAI